MLANEEFRSVFGNKITLTQSGINHMLKRHPELKHVDLMENLRSTIEDPDYVVQGKFDRHIAIKLQPQMIGKAKYMVTIYKEGGEIITSFITSKLEKILKRRTIWKRH